MSARKPILVTYEVEGGHRGREIIGEMIVLLQERESGNTCTRVNEVGWTEVKAGSRYLRDEISQSPPNLHNNLPTPA